MKKLSLQTIVWKEGKHWVAQCLNIDISSFGNTQKQALANVKEALELYFEDRGARENVPKVKSATIRSTLLQYA
jgi:predicted RNase H-like HicB family nuclease